MKDKKRPIIHSNHRLLRHKLREKEVPCNWVKRIGQYGTIVIGIKRQEPKVPILSNKTLKKFLRFKKTKQQPKPPRQILPPLLTPSPPPQLSPPSLPPTQQPKCPSPQQQPPPSSPPQQPTPLPPPQQQPPSPPRPTQQSPCPAPPPSQPSQPYPNKSEATHIRAFAVGKLDQLVISEPFQDEYAKYYDDDDDEEEESVMSRNLKKIRTQPPPQKPNSSKEIHPQSHKTTTQPNRSPPPHGSRQPAPKAGPSAPFATPQVQPQDQQSTGDQQQAQLPQVNGVAVEHKWTDTEVRLNQGDLDNTYKDLLHQKDKIKSSDLAKQLLKQLVVKCIVQDETKWFLDILNIVFELSELFQDDNVFWQELIKRLQTKLSPWVKYKSKANHDYVKSIYKEALSNLSQHLYNNGHQQLTLPFQTMVFVATPIVHKIDAQSAPPSAPTKVERKENSDPSQAVLGDRKIFKTGLQMPLFQGSHHMLPVLQIKREIKKERPSMDMRQ